MFYVTDISGRLIPFDPRNVAWAGAARPYRITGTDRVADGGAKEADDTVQSVEGPAVMDGRRESGVRVNPVQRDPYRKLPLQPERKRALIAADLMSAPVFTISEAAPVEEAKEVFRNHRYRHIPVLSPDQRLVGILADRDFLSGALDHAEVVRECMVTNILTARPEASIREVAEVMMLHHIGCLPIVDEGGALVGVLTRSDILRAIVNCAPVELWT